MIYWFVICCTAINIAKTISITINEQCSTVVLSLLYLPDLPEPASDYTPPSILRETKIPLWWDALLAINFLFKYLSEGLGLVFGACVDRLTSPVHLSALPKD